MVAQCIVLLLAKTPLHQVYHNGWQSLAFTTFVLRSATKVEETLKLTSVGSFLGMHSCLQSRHVDSYVGITLIAMSHGIFVQKIQNALD
jgi:hypothetical protein